MYVYVCRCQGGEEHGRRRRAGVNKHHDTPAQLAVRREAICSHDKHGVRQDVLPSLAASANNAHSRRTLYVVMMVVV